MFNLLLAASSSFINDQVLTERLSLVKQRRPDAEIHIITQPHWTKMVRDKIRCVVHPRDFALYAGGATTKAYEAILEHADGAVIFWDGESKPEQQLIRRCQERPLQHEVIRFESLKQELERLRKEGKVEKRKKITVPLSSYAKQRYKAAHLEWSKKTNPAAYRDGFYSGPKIPVINSGSRGSSFIVQFLEWQGWDATTVSTTGRQLPDGTWIKGTTKLGSADVFATIKGKSCKFEVKHSTDTPKQDQLDRQAKARAAGGISEFIYTREFDYFFQVYDKIIAGTF